MTRGYLALGSNMGDRAANLERALGALRCIPGISVGGVAHIYSSAAVGPVGGQEDFLNTVAEIETALAPGDLLEKCLEIERSLGRVRRVRQGPRPIDIDIIWLEGKPIATPALTVPHPEAHRRRFVLVPLRELAPGLELAGRSLDEWIPDSEPREILAVEAQRR